MSDAPAAMVPLTPAQERLWFLQQAGLDGSVYVVWAVQRITGPLDVEAMRRAIGGLLARHEVLRCAIVTDAAGRPAQVVRDGLDVPLEVVDVSSEADARAAAQSFLSRPFELDRPPLLRVLLTRLAADDHVLALTAHHLVCDGPSLGVLMEELYGLYRGEELAPQPVGFPDYALWLAGQDDSALDAARAHWRAELAGAPAVLELPFDHPRPARPTSRGRRHSVPLSAELLQGIGRTARETRGSVFMVVMTALAVVLARFADEEEVVVGAPASNRQSPGLERSVGMYVNTLAFRADLRGDPSIAEALVRVRRTVLRALGHQSLPFDEVADLAGGSRDLSHNPVFQVMLVVDLPGSGAEPPPGLTVTSWDLSPPTARFDLTVLATVGESGGLAFDYAADLFEPPTVERLADDLVGVLTALTGDRDRRVGEIPFSVAEQPEAEVSRAAVTLVHEQIAARAAAVPEALAVLAPGGTALDSGTLDYGTLDYGTLDRRANHLAHRLRELGVTSQTPVGVALPAGPDAVVAILGVLKAGGAYVPLDPGQPPVRLARMLTDVAAPLVVGSVPGHHSIALDGGEAAQPPETTCLPGHLAYIVFTSGSTGRPKGVAVTHATLARLTASFQETHDCFTAGQRVLMLPPLTFDASVGDLFPALTGGAALVLHPEAAALTGPELVGFCSRHGVTAVDTASALWRQWTEDLRNAEVPVDWPVTTMMVGGERVPTASLREWARITGGRVTFFNHYGPTEATVCATVHRTVDGAECGDAVSLPIGRPLPHVRVRVLDRYGRRVPPGVRGELHLAGACLARGYVADPELTAERFPPDPFATEPDARMYRTGDLVRWGADGTLEFLGRADRQVKLRGRRIEPGEVEAAVAAHPGVREVAVVVRDDAPGGPALVAYVVGALSHDEELRSFLLESLPDYLVPAFFVRLDRIPLTAHGKLDHDALPVPTAPAQRPYTAPQGRVETELAGIWARLLDLERVGRHDGFFDLGGHSLLAGSVVSEAERVLGVKVPVRALFEAADVAALAAMIEMGQADPRVPVDLRASVDLRAESVLPGDVCAELGGSRSGRPRLILLTGATGFLGSHVLAELLRRDDAVVRCLVRAASQEAAAGRVRETLLRHGLWEEAYAGRIEAVPGDLTLPRLGLSPSEHRALAAETDLICHLGRLVDFVRPFDRLRGVNVTGMTEILRLAGSGPVTPVHTVSTLGVFLGTAGTVTEATPAVAAPYDAYYQSRWVGEQLALGARERGLPVSIHRPARIGGHSRTGRWNTGDYFSRMLVGCAQLGLVPDLEHGEDVIAVDHVAAAVGHLALTGAARDFHYFNHATVTYREVAEAFADVGIAVEPVPWATWLAQVRARMEEGRELAVAPLLATFSEEPPAPRRPSFDCSVTEHALAGAGIPGPPSGRDLITRSIEFFVGEGLLRDVWIPSCRG